MKTKRFFQIFSLCIIGLMCSACEEPEAKFESYLQKGDRFFEQSDYIRARLEYKNAAKVFPSSANIIYKLGLVEEAEANFQLALSAFTSAEQQDPTFIPVRIKLAEFFLIARQYDAAQERIDAVLAIEPDNSKARALKGSLLLSQKSYRLAENEIDLALKADADNIIAYSVLAGISIANKKYDQALETLEKALKINPDELATYLLIATVYSEQNNTDGVVDIYEKMFKRFPEKTNLKYDLADILSELDKPTEAKKLLERITQENPDDQNAKLRLLKFIETQEGINHAKGKIETFINDAPDQKIYALWLADLYARNQEHEKAIATLETIIDTNPNDWLGLNAQTSLAQVKLNVGDIKFAKDLINLVLTKEINNLDALFLNANLTFMQGDLRQAISEFREILNNDPKYAEASQMLAEIFLIQNRIDLAIDTLLQAIKNSPDQQTIHVRLAQLYALRGESETALEILTKITDLDPDSAIAWESTARIALESGNASTVEKAIEKLESIEKQETTAEFLTAQLNIQDDKKDDARQTLKDILERDINAPIAIYALSELLKISETEQHLSDIASFLNNANNQTSEILTVLGTINAQLGEQDSALINFQNAIANNPKTQDPFISLARLYINTQDLQQAINILNQAETIVPSEINASMLKAEILIGTQQYDAAITTYENILSKNDRVDDAANNMTHIIAEYRYQDMEKLEKARIVAERFINADNPYYLDTLGWVYARLELYTQAQAILKRAVELLEEPNPQIQYHYGFVLQKLGLNDQAKTHLNKAVQTNTPYTGLEDAQKLLEQLSKQP